MKRVRMPDGLEVWALNASDAGVLHRQIFERGAYRVALHDGACVFDVGANIGLFSLWALRQWRLKLFAFEPVPQVFEALQRNVTGATLVQCALGAQPGTAELTWDPLVSSMSRIGPAQALPVGAVAADFDVPRMAVAALELGRRVFRRRVRCPVRTVAEIIDAYGVERIDLLKIDVEGAELQVLCGVREWHRVQQVIVETDVPAQVAALLRAQGFTTQTRQEPGETFARLGLHDVYGTRGVTS